MLALHFERGRDALRAVRYRHLAAEQAILRCAYPEAIEHLARGREQLGAVADEGQRPALELGLQMTLGPALIALRGSGAPEAEAVYLRARELAESLGDTRRLHPALWGLCFVNYSRGRTRRRSSWASGCSPSPSGAATRSGGWRVTTCSGRS